MKSGFYLLFLFWLFKNGRGTDFKNCPSNGTNRIPPSFKIVQPTALEDSGILEPDFGSQFKLECRAPYPIQLVFDASEQSRISYGWSVVAYTDFLNISTYKFEVVREGVTFQRHWKVETIVCVSVDSPCLQHRLQIYNTSESGDKLRFELENSTTHGLSLPDFRTVAVNTSDKCDALFYYEDAESGKYNFRCTFDDGTPGTIKMSDCGNSLSCNHILRKGTLKTGCWSHYVPNSCTNCTVTPSNPNFVSFVATCAKKGRESEIGSLVFFGVASIDAPRPKIFFSPKVLKNESEYANLINIVEFKRVQDLNTPLELECRTSGYATAGAMQLALEFEGESQLKYLTVVNPNWENTGSYRSVKQSLRLNDTRLIKIHCYASIESAYEWLHTARPIKVQDPFAMILIIISIVVPVVLIVGILVGFLFWKIKKLKNALRNLTEDEIRDFKYGNGLLDPNDVHAPIHGRPFNKDLEISRDLLELDEQCILGSGQYGIVMKGYLLDKSKVKSSTGKELVAVKTVKPDVDVETFKALLSEIKIMGYLDKHENIVGLLGACTKNIKEREVWAAIEFCGNGDLLGYLQKRRKTFKNLFESLPPNNNSSTYINVVSSSGEYENTPFTTLDLLKFAEGIADGMHYLTIKNVIHGDLAARNVLVTDTMGMKVSDFGLSRQLLQYSNYVKTQQVPLPYKWLAIESLKDMEFSIKSDVWAYGVVLWEIFSLGETPYPGYSWTHEFLDQLTSGYRMKRPDFANEPIYDIMLDCWRLLPDTRPSFDVIHSRILQIQADLTAKTNTNAKC